MRVSTANRYEATVDSLQQRQRDMAEAQTAMTNGKRINKPSDDPTGAARAERAYLSGQRIASEQRSVDASRNAMTLAEAALGQAGELLQSARETLVAAGNGSAGRARPPFPSWTRPLAWCPAAPAGRRCCRPPS